MKAVTPYDSAGLSDVFLELSALCGEYLHILCIEVIDGGNELVLDFIGKIVNVSELLGELCLTRYV